MIAKSSIRSGVRLTVAVRSKRGSERKETAFRRLDITVEYVQFFNLHLRLALLNFILNKTETLTRAINTPSNKDQISVSTMRIAFSVWNGYD
ncbi:hypothetical protein T10_9535 [Trichinella papuae]|uniref:Uncharacterized protein n=1 Tax=Trichinella papuae TaxID=268474 RepID=A0A0V1MV40_9BILA|nr:hypothetical protein T10_9535 [Trichinella papuae]